MEPGITLAVIVRNDAERLRRCLRSVKGFVAKMLVVDTGSSDQSAEIARQEGAAVHFHAWNDAFDEARNYAFDRIETEWTMFLDSDEWLVEEDRPKLQKAIDQDEAFAYYLIARNLYDDDSYTEMRHLRLWRTHPKMRHIGVCHAQIPEQALNEASDGRKLFESDIHFWHDGYKGGYPPQKHLRGIRLMRKELELRPGQLYYEIELARTLLVVGDPEGEKMLDEVTDKVLGMSEDDEAPSPLAVALLQTALDRMPPDQLASARADMLILLLRGWFPSSPIAHWSVASAEIKRGKPREALRSLLEIERMAETGEYDRYLSFHPTIFGEGLWTNLALVAHQLGRADIARRNYERLLRLKPDHEVARQNLAML